MCLSWLIHPLLGLSFCSLGGFPCSQLILSCYRWGTTLSDIAVVFGILLAVIVVLLHQHRLVILCRVWVILGILYFYRAIAMLVTAFPHPDPAFTCAPKLNETLDFEALVSRAAIAFSTGGLTFSQNSIFCGDFMFSGHTMTLVMWVLFRALIVTCLFCLFWSEPTSGVSPVIFWDCRHWPHYLLTLLYQSEKLSKWILRLCAISKK